MGQIFIVRRRTVDGLDNMIVKQYSTVAISPMRSWREETMTLEAETSNERQCEAVGDAVELLSTSKKVSCCSRIFYLESPDSWE